MNRKGFTLVELLATLVVLAIVVSIGTYSIVAVINNAKVRNYKLMVSNIKSAAETYYQECRYAKTSITSCKEVTGKKYVYEVSLSDLVSGGFLNYNSDDMNSFVNPKTKKPIATCKISIGYSGGKVEVTSSPNSSSDCPTNADYKDN